MNHYAGYIIFIGLGLFCSYLAYSQTVLAQVPIVPEFTATTGSTCGGTIAVAGTLANGGWTTYLQVIDENTRETVFFGVGWGSVTGSIDRLPGSTHMLSARVYNGWGNVANFPARSVVASTACPEPSVEVNFN